jgi:hypothetical protein
MKIKQNEDIFEKIKEEILKSDPLHFCKNYLSIDGKSLDLTANGYKPLADIYRYVGVKALEKISKPIVLVKSRQVGGTIMCAALEMYFMGCGLFGTNNRPPIRVMHLFPILETAAVYSKTKLQAMISSSKPVGEKGPKQKSYMESLVDQSSGFGESMRFKQFKNGNHLFFEAPGDNGDRLRSRTVDVIFFDEIQDMNKDAVGNAVKILNKAQYGNVGDGVQVYLGTPKQKGSHYYKYWENSSQQYFHLGCEKCKKTFPLYDGTDNWEKIWLYEFVVKCTNCGHEQHKNEAINRGKWIATRPLSDCSFIGFHINMLYGPDFSKEYILSQKPGIHPTNTERLYRNEVLGEFFSGETGIISSDEIRTFCADHERKMVSYIESKSSPVFLGMDWGAKSAIEQLADSDSVKTQGKSYSVATILQVDPTNNQRLILQFATRLKDNTFEYKKEFVRQVMKNYNVSLAVGDIGFAGEVSEILQNEYGDRFLTSRAAGRINNKIDFNEKIFPKEIIFEKDYYIAELYDQLRKGNIRFPYGHYDYIAWLINHITSMEIRPSISRSGDVTPHYIKGSSPNDGFMSLLNAYIAYKFYATDGFKIKNPLLFKKKQDQPMPAFTAVRLPRL